MAIKLPTGFEITSTQPIDTRITLTKAQMLATLDTKMPAVYFAICKDNGKLYLYNKTNTVDPETGKFRIHEGGSGGGNVDDVKVDGVSVVTDKIANIDLATPLAGKLDTMPGDEYTKGNAYNLPYYFEQDVQADKVVVHAKTVSLDGNKVHGDYTMDVAAATQSTAGLLSANDKVRVNKAVQEDDVLILNCNYTE